MTTYLVKPMEFTEESSGGTATGTSVINTNFDAPGLVWRSTSLTTPHVVIDLGSSVSDYDTVAVIGSNLRSTDTVRIRTGDATTGTGVYDHTALAAYSGTKPEGWTTKSIYKLNSTRDERYIRIDFVATSHPDSYVEVQRFVVGKRVTAEGIAADAEMGFVDQSIATEFPGLTVYDEYPVVPYWKFQIHWVTDAEYQSSWVPLLSSVGHRRAVLFVPDYETTANHQVQAIFGRFTNNPNPMKHILSNTWTGEFQIKALAP